MGEESMARVVLGKVARIVGGNMPGDACQRLDQRDALVLVFFVREGRSVLFAVRVGFVCVRNGLVYVGVGVAVGADPGDGFLVHDCCQPAPFAAAQVDVRASTITSTGATRAISCCS